MCGFGKLTGAVWPMSHTYACVFLWSDLSQTLNCLLACAGATKAGARQVCLPKNRLPISSGLCGAFAQRNLAAGRVL